MTEPDFITSSLAMLCSTCLDIFSKPRDFGIGSYYPWKHTIRSFDAAIKDECHLCNLVFQHILYHNPNATLADVFRDSGQMVNPATYAFKALGREWARTGRGPKWLTPVIRPAHDLDEVGEYLRAVNHDPTILRIRKVLVEKSLDQGIQLDHPLVWDLYRPGPAITLPVEIAQVEIAEDLAQAGLSSQSSTGSEQTLALAKHWVNNCIENHPQCKSLFQDSHWLPTRLIYIGSVEDPTVRLVQSTTLEGNQRYASLSYCWGDTQDCILETTRLHEYETFIPSSTISKTVGHAIQIARAIGLQYLWVDRLCIIQDDEADWLREASTMSKVYGVSACTIVAASATSGQQGCFVNRNQYRARPCQIPNPFNQESDISFLVRSQYLRDIYTREVKESAWYTRGWVFQERTLSSRLLIFGEHQVLWACETIQASEMWPCGKSSDAFIDRFESFEAEKRKLKSLCDASRVVDPHETLWWDFILDYTGCKSSRSSDRLIALQGIATRIEAMTRRVYIAGLWFDDTLLYSLLWRAVSDDLPKAENQRAPSWSWGAIDGRIAIDLSPGLVEPMANIIDHQEGGQDQGIVSIDLKITGGLLDAWLSKVHGTLMLSKWRLSPSDIPAGGSYDVNGYAPVRSRRQRFNSYLVNKWNTRTAAVKWSLAIVVSPIWLPLALTAVAIALPILFIYYFLWGLSLLLDTVMNALLGRRWDHFRTMIRNIFSPPEDPMNPADDFETHSMKNARLGHIPNPGIHAAVNLDYQVDLSDSLHLKLLPLARFKGKTHGLVLQPVGSETALTFQRIGVFSSESPYFSIATESMVLSLC